MEQVIEAQELEARRARVASFIKASLKPAKHLLEEGALDALDKEISEEAQNFEVREHQLDAWGNVWDARQAGAKKALIHLATGLGKTSVAVFDVIKFREEYKAEHGREPRILFTCHQNEIIDQAAERFEAFIPDMSHGFYAGKNKERDADITFATLQSLHKSLDTFDEDEFDYIVYDEAHHSKAETFEQVVSYFKPAFQLALTATPNRLDELDIRELFGEEVYSKGLPQALAEGLLATPDYHIVFDDAVKEAMEAGFEAKTLKDLKGLFENKPRNEVIVQNIKDEIARIGLEFGDVKTIIFCEGIDHAVDMAQLLGGEAYHSDMKKGERKRIFDDFRHGDLQTICTRDMFNEGVDVPDARLLVFLRSTSSQTIFEQQLGRGLRKQVGKDEVSVLDFVANVERIVHVRELAEKIKEYTPYEPYDNRGTNEDIPSNTERNNPKEGIDIHTSHGDFDFDKICIDLLAKFKSLKREEREYNPLNQLSNEEIIKLALKIKPDAPLSSEELKQLSADKLFVSATAIARRFEGILKFHKACGFETINAKILGDEDIVALAKELSPGAPLTSSEIVTLSKKGLFVGKTAIARRFGSIDKFHQACGFEKKAQLDLRTLTNEGIVALALEISPDKPLKHADLQKLSKEGLFVGSGWINSHFGSIHDFHEACGFVPTQGWTMDKESMIKRAQELSPDKPLSRGQITKLAQEGTFTHYTTVVKRFGSLSEFHRACGFDVKAAPRKSRRLNARHMDEQSIIDLALQIKRAKPLSTTEIETLSKNHQFVSMRAITTRFGSLSEFHRACGFDAPGRIKVNERMRNLTPVEAVELARQISPDKPLTKRDIEFLSTSGKFIGSARVKNLFGTISEFQIACGFQPNKPRKP